MKIKHMVEIAAGAPAVFSWLADPERARAWQGEVAGYEVLSRTPQITGTTFRETVSDGGQSLEMRGTVTACEPDRRIAFQLESRIHRLEVDYRLEEIDGGVRLTQTADVRWKFPMNLIMLMAGRDAAAQLRTQSENELAALKRLCEQQPHGEAERSA